MNKRIVQSSEQTKLNVAKLAELFPHIITEVRAEDGTFQQAVDLELLKREISGFIAEREGGMERFQLSWLGKKQAVLAANQQPAGYMLVPVEAESVSWHTTGNLYIEGDNLLALQLLQVSYADKVKCIYIDPPYNTGKDFIYKDDYKQSSEQYLKMSGQIDDKGKRLLHDTESGGRFHSDWLTDMYPRLKLARQLLRGDGVIFISIDDREQAHLRLICDEIFGSGNFVANLVWANKEGGGGSDSKFFRVKHEYILCYAKSIDQLTVKGIGISNESRYTMQDEYVGRRGKYYLQKLNQASIQYSKSLDYAIQAPDGTEIWPSRGNKLACWRWSESKLAWGMANGFIVIKQDHYGDWQVYSKQYMHVDNKDQPIVRTNRPLGLIEEYSSTQACKKLEQLFGEKVFDYSKPLELILFLLGLTTEADDLVLDYYSGSATTAHAVMQLNAEDGARRRYIMVQLPEETAEGSEASRAGYANICEIGKERIRRAAAKVQEETGAEIDGGFRVYRVEFESGEKVSESVTT